MLVVDNNCTKQLVYNPRIDIHRLKTLVRNICLLFVECKEKQREKKIELAKLVHLQSQEDWEEMLIQENFSYVIPVRFINWIKTYLERNKIR